MNADDLTEAVRADQQTELSRLGSSKMLYADTRGEMEPDAVTAAAAARERDAHETFDAWSADTEGEAADIFADAAAGAADRLDATDVAPADREFAVYEILADFDGSVERLGGFLGWTLVDKKVKEQLTGFFTGQADPQTASTYRSAGSEIEELRADAGDLLETACETEADWEAAEAAAIAVVEAAYEEYFETLEELGVNPKPVC
jgi:hypothetical protein